MVKSLFKNGELAWELKEYPLLSDSSGELGVVELGKDFDFDVKRVFFLRKVHSEQVRGKHSHVDLKQFIVCLNGSYTISLDNGTCKDYVRMNSENKCLYIDGRVWREMYDFSNDAVMIVLCDREYRFDTVIRDRLESNRILNGLI